MRVTKQEYELLAERAAAPTKRMQVRTVIGIDPGTHTGVAVLTHHNQALQAVVYEFDFWGCYDFVNEKTFTQTTVLVIEQGGLNSPLFSSIAARMEAQARAQGRTITPKDREAFRRAENKHAMHVGGANQESELLIRGFRRLGYHVLPYRPVAGKKWQTQEQVLQHTGLRLRTNDHTRVALRSAWEYRHLLLAGVYEYK